MVADPGFAGIAALMGDPARATMLGSLARGAALTATELAATAEITKQTASAHLARLLEAQLVVVEAQGRHRYFRLANRDVVRALEGLMGVAERLGRTPAGPGPSEPGLRKARVCFDHLAGELGVRAYESMKERGFLQPADGELALTDAGRKFAANLGIYVTALATQRRRLCRPCLDWSVRRHHLAGAVGAALLERCMELKWARRARDSRLVVFSTAGERAFRQRFPLPPRED